MLANAKKRPRFKFAAVDPITTSNRTHRWMVGTGALHKPMPLSANRHRPQRIPDAIVTIQISDNGGFQCVRVKQWTSFDFLDSSAERFDNDFLAEGTIPILARTHRRGWFGTVLRALRLDPTGGADEQARNRKPELVAP